MILLIRPLMDAGLISPDIGLSIHALSGYSGGGRSLNERWEDPKRGLIKLGHEAPYSIGKVHKHIPEMMHHGLLATEPQFRPAVGPFRCGMRVEIMILAKALSQSATAQAMWDAFMVRYEKEAFIEVEPLTDASEADELTFDPQANCSDSESESDARRSGRHRAAGVTVRVPFKPFKKLKSSRIPQLRSIA